MEVGNGELKCSLHMSNTQFQRSIIKSVAICLRLRLGMAHHEQEILTNNFIHILSLFQIQRIRMGTQVVRGCLLGKVDKVDVHLHDHDAKEEDIPASASIAAHQAI